MKSGIWNSGMMISRGNDPKIALFQLGKLLASIQNLYTSVKWDTGMVQIHRFIRKKTRVLTHSYYIDIY